MYISLALAISPPTVEFDVPSDGSTEVEFTAYDFNGNLAISLEGIPLTVAPTIVPVTAEGTRFILTFYGDQSLGSQTFVGKILFVGVVYGQPWTVGIKVRATIHHIAEGVPPEKKIPSWLLPAGIGVGVVLIAAVAKGKKK